MQGVTLTIDDRKVRVPAGATLLEAAEKLGIEQVIVPVGAGVGSAHGFLRAPIAYEVVRTRLMQLQSLDVDTLNGLFESMRTEAEAVVRLGAPHDPLVESREAMMRYRGLGHEIVRGCGGEARHLHQVTEDLECLDVHPTITLSNAHSA